MSDNAEGWRRKKRGKNEDDKFLFGDSHGRSFKSLRVANTLKLCKNQAPRILHPASSSMMSHTAPVFPQKGFPPAAFLSKKFSQPLFKNVKLQPQSAGVSLLPQPVGCLEKIKPKVIGPSHNIDLLNQPQDGGPLQIMAVEESCLAQSGVTITQREGTTLPQATATRENKLLTTNKQGVTFHHEQQRFPVEAYKPVQYSGNFPHTVQCDEIGEERDLDPKHQPQLEDLLYVGSRISVEDSLYAILSFAHSENLTLSSVSRLLALIELHCPENSKCFTSCHDLFKLAEKCESPVVLSFYCTVCFKLRKSKDDICDTCNESEKRVEYFVHFPLSPQISKLYKRPNFLSSIKYKYNRVKENRDHYEDIYDGEVYKEAEASVLVNSNNISLTWHGDGVQKYESSSYSLCTFYYTINELSPADRFKPENILVGAIWGSKEKPHPNILLKHTADDLSKFSNGVEVVSSKGEKEVIKVILLCGTCDSPAKASFFNSKTHSGYYSCPCCFTKGEKSQRTGNVMAFPFEEQLILRTTENYRPLVEASIQSFKSPEEQDKICKGVKGPTLLSDVLFSSMFDSTAVDGMHCLYLGLVKQLLVLLFSEDYKQEPFSLFEFVGVVNTRLLSLKLPEFVQRLPLSVLKLVYWKGTLCRNFFFYMMLPILEDIMEEKYFSHLTFLVDSMALLNGRSVSQDEIIVADLKISEFVKGFETLYGLRHMSFNLHLCRHAARCVRMLGPLWVTSCFPYEDLNGKMANLAHGTKDAPIQIAKRMSVITEMPLSIENLPSGVAKSFCQRMSQKWRRLHINDVVGDNKYIVGFYDKNVMCETEIREFLQVLSPDLINFVTFPKLFYNRKLYVASSYTRTSRVSSYVKYKKINSHLYGEIVTFVKVVGSEQIFAYVIRQEVQTFRTNILKYIHQGFVGGVSYDLVPLDQLLSLCFKISVENKLFICDALNDFEFD